MKRGELYRVRKPGGDPKQSRVFVVVSRQVLLDSRFSTVICAPVFSEGHDLQTQVPVGVPEGLKQPSWIMCDSLVGLPKAVLTDHVGAVRGEALARLDRALRVALGVE